MAEYSRCREATPLTSWSQDQNPEGAGGKGGRALSRNSVIFLWRVVTLHSLCENKGSGPCTPVAVISASVNAMWAPGRARKEKRATKTPASAQRAPIAARRREPLMPTLFLCLFVLNSAAPLTWRPGLTSRSRHCGTSVLGQQARVWQHLQGRSRSQHTWKGSRPLCPRASSALRLPAPPGDRCLLTRHPLSTGSSSGPARASNHLLPGHHLMR